MQHWRVVRNQDIKLELSLLYHLFGMKVHLSWTKLRKSRKTLAENDFKKIDKLKDCLQRQLQEAISRDKSTDLISPISQLPQDELAHALFPSDHFPSLSTKETFHIPR